MFILEFIKAMAITGTEISVIAIGNLVSITSKHREEIVECSTVRGADFLSASLEDYYTEIQRRNLNGDVIY